MHCLHVEGEKIFVQKAVVLQLVIPWQFLSCAHPGMRKTCPYLVQLRKRKQLTVDNEQSFPLRDTYTRSTHACA